MMLLTERLRAIQAAFAETGIPAHHHYRPKDELPSLVWAEDSEGMGLAADNHKAEQQLHCTVDYYTQDEYDPAIDTIQAVLDTKMDGWRLDSAQYEEDTKLIHYGWEFYAAG